MIVVRVATLAIALVAPLTGRAGHPPAPFRPASDLRVLRRTAELAAHQRPGSTIHRLRRLSAVASAGLGRDGRTIDVTFRDGLQTAILPAGGHARLQIPHSRVAFKPAQTAGEPEAAVLNPFARDPGFDTGAPEVGDLQTAGFHVNHLVDDAVTVNAMASLSRYSVVYLDTHSGVNQWGDGVIVTGQLANDDPALAPMIKDRSIWIVGVAGDPHLYYGILSRFVTTSVGMFPPHALLFFNGCGLLKSTLLWQALAAKGAGVMVSWDQDVRVLDGTAAGSAFLDTMAHGASVEDAVAALRSNARGVSIAMGTVSLLGYVGDGSVTLREAGDGSRASTPVPTATSPATSSPVPATLPPTPVPPALSIERITVLHRVSGHWRSGRTVRLGEAIRFEVTYRAAGVTPAGTVHLARGGRTLLSAPLHSITGELRANLRLRDRRLIGHLTAMLSLRDGGLAAHRSIGLDVRP